MRRWMLALGLLGCDGGTPGDGAPRQEGRADSTPAADARVGPARDGGGGDAARDAGDPKDAAGDAHPVGDAARDSAAGDAARDAGRPDGAASDAAATPVAASGLSAASGPLRSARHVLFATFAPVEPVGPPLTSPRHRAEPGLLRVLDPGPREAR